jgi:hypothetical protein
MSGQKSSIRFQIESGEQDPMLAQSLCALLFVAAGDQR